MSELQNLLEALVVVENIKKKLDCDQTSKNCFEQLKSICEIETLVFEDDSSLNIDKECSNHILALHEMLDSREKTILEMMVNASEQTFLKVLELAVKNKG